jgi:hypothetical protein
VPGFGCSSKLRPNLACTKKWIAHYLKNIARIPYLQAFNQTHPAMKQAAYIIQCYGDSRHEIPVVLQIEEKDKKNAPRKIEIQCPVCGKWNIADIGVSISPDTTVYRGIKKTE